MEDLVAAAAEAMNIPPEMVERSAQARAEADGVSVEDVLTAWAGGEPVPAETAPEPEAVEEATESTEEPQADTATPAETAAPAEDAEPAAIDPTDQAALIRAAAAKMDMPESMIERSAAARARAAGRDPHSVLLDWAGVDSDTIPPPTVAAQVPDQPVVAEPGPSQTAEEAAAEEPAAAEPSPSQTAGEAAAEEPAASLPAMDEGALLAAAAEQMGMPESMVQRSASARSKAEGIEVAAVLAEWAGVEAPVAAPAGEAPEPAAAAPAQETSEPAAAVPVEPDQAGPSADTPADEPEPEPESEFEPEEVAVAAGALPRWLAALFVVVPAFALGYALFLPNGPNCGDAGSLAIDPVTGLAVNCDGSEYGSTEVDLFGLGQTVYDSAGCTACHGPDGAGVGNFPAFTGGELLATFPDGSCSAQVEWIALGTTGWPDPTYGTTEKPVGGSGAVMPGFESTLTPEELAAVSLYERVEFAGQDIEAATNDCAPGEDAAAE